LKKKKRVKKVDGRKGLSENIKKSPKNKSREKAVTKKWLKKKRTKR